MRLPGLGKTPEESPEEPEEEQPEQSDHNDEEDEPILDIVTDEEGSEHEENPIEE